MRFDINIFNVMNVSRSNVNNSNNNGNNNNMSSPGSVSNLNNFNSCNSNNGIDVIHNRNRSGDSYNDRVLQFMDLNGNSYEMDLNNDEDASYTAYDKTNGNNDNVNNVNVTEQLEISKSIRNGSRISFSNKGKRNSNTMNAIVNTPFNSNNYNSNNNINRSQHIRSILSAQRQLQLHVLSVSNSE